MNRIEFMTELAALLQDISVEERTEAMQYYNDYFDDAGVENELHIINELGSPAKVAAEVKAGLGGQNQNASEYRETGYTDTRFEEKESLARKEHTGNDSDESYEYAGDKAGQQPPRTSNALKIALIILIVIVGAPVLIPIAIAIVSVVFALGLALFCFFFALVIAALAITVIGVSLFCAGIVALVPELAVGLALIGTGILLTVVGIIATVATVKLCLVVFPGIFRGLVWICRRPFEGRKAVA